MAAQAQHIYSPITIIEGNPCSAWEPRNLKERLSRTPRDECQAKVHAADARRQLLRRSVLQRISAHNERVKAVSTMACAKAASSPRTADTRQQRACERRAQLQMQRAEKIAAHHDRVTKALTEKAKPQLSARRLASRHKLAQQRRMRLLAEQAESLQQHNERITKALERRRAKEQLTEKRARKVIESYKLDSEAIEDASFDEVQRVLSNRATVSRAKDLLQLISRSFEKVLVEEKQRITEDTPVGPAGAKDGAAFFVGKIPSNPRAFLSAYICKSGLVDPPFPGCEVPQQEPDPLETAVQEHAASLISALQNLLASLEEDSQLSEQETKDLMKAFARQWVDYEACFEAWKKKDYQQLLNHYIETYSEVERGRFDIVMNVAAKGSRRPEAHAELMTAIDESLTRIRTQIQRIGGDKGTEELGRRLQTLYDTHQITPQVRPAAAATPITSDLEVDTSSCPSPGAAMPPAASSSNEEFTTTATSDAAKPAATSSNAALERAKTLQNMLLKAKIAHDAVFSKESKERKEQQEKEESAGDQLTVKRIKKAAEKAFWDILGEELACCPPIVDRLGAALEGLKEKLVDVTPRKMKDRLKAEFDDCLDWDILKQSFNKGTLAGLVKFFVDKILELEAPAENEATKAATRDVLTMIESDAELSDVAPKALQFVHDKLTALDEAIHEARKSLIGPVLARDAEELVRTLHNTEVAQGVHSFLKTKAWLKATLEATVPLTATAKPEELGFQAPMTLADVEEKTNKLYTVTPVLAMLRGITQPKTLEPFPESLRLHRDLLRIHADKVQMLTLAAAISGLAGQLSGCPGKVVKPLCEEVPEMLMTPGMRLSSIIEQVLHIVDRERGTLLPEAQRKLLAGLLEKVAHTDDKVFQTYHKRLSSIVSEYVVNGPKPEVLAASPFANFSAEVNELTASVAKLCTVNLKWNRPFYDPLLSAIVNEAAAQKQEALDAGEL